jgi:predicted nuclease of restriction endonuclease-like (RecB) superfamily
MYKLQVAAVRQQLGWTHFKQLIPIDDALKREFYAEMCRTERWSTRTLESKIQSMLFERTALSRKPDKLIAQELKALREEDKLTPDLVFRDPYLFDFLGLRDTYAERDLEAAILREMEAFILELGVGFAFMERQSASSWTVMIITWTCSFFTADCSDWWRSNLNWGISNRQTRHRWSCIFVGWINTSVAKGKMRLSGLFYAPAKRKRPFDCWMRPVLVIMAEC